MSPSSSLTPAPDGRLDATGSTTIEGWKAAAQLMSGAPFAVGIQSVHATGRITGIRRERAMALLAATGALVGALPPGFMAQDDKADLPPAARAQLRGLVDSLQDLLTAISVEETLDGVQAEVAGMGGLAMKRFLIGFGGEAPGGRLHAWLRLGLEDLATPSLPPKIATLLPHHIDIRPSLSGVLTSDLHKLALDATEEGADVDSLEPDIAAIFAHGGIKLALEALAFDIGPAKVEGTGQITALSPDAWHGEAHVEATGLDDLTGLARGNPDLQQALPVLILLRGLGKPDGKQLVWDIVSDGPSVTVNGLDLSQLGGGDGAREARSEAEAVERDLSLRAVLQFQAGRHAVAGERGEAVIRQIGPPRIGDPDLGLRSHPAQPRQDAPGHRRLVADVAAQDEIPAAVGTDDVSDQHGDRHVIRRGVQRDRGASEGIDLGGFNGGGARTCAGDGGEAASRCEVEHPPTGGDGGIVQHVARQCLPARPGEGPEWRIDVVLGQPCLRGLPDRGDLIGEVEHDLGDQRSAVGDRLRPHEALLVAWLQHCPAMIGLPASTTPLPSASPDSAPPGGG